MVLFAPKGRDWNREAMWEAVRGRREVGILPLGKMLGPKDLRNTLQMLLLDRVWLEDYFGDALQLRAWIEGRTFHLDLANVRDSEIEGELVIRAAPEIAVKDQASLQVAIPPRSVKEYSFRLQPGREAMGRTNPVLATVSWGSHMKRTLAVMDLPPAISVLKLLYGQSPEVVFPVSIHNFGEAEYFPVRVEAYAAGSPGRPVYEKTETGQAPPSGFAELTFRLPLKPGGYFVRISALGVEAESQLGVGSPSGQATCLPVDIDGDGVSEYALENDRVRITLLVTQAHGLCLSFCPAG